MNSHGKQKAVRQMSATPAASDFESRARRSTITHHDPLWASRWNDAQPAALHNKHTKKMWLCKHHTPQSWFVIPLSLCVVNGKYREIATLWRCILGTKFISPGTYSHLSSLHPPHNYIFLFHKAYLDFLLDLVNHFSHAPLYGGIVGLLHIGDKSCESVTIHHRYHRSHISILTTHWTHRPPAHDLALAIMILLLNFGAQSPFVLILLFDKSHNGG